MPVNESLANEQWQRYVYARDRSHLEFIQKADKCDRFFAGQQWRQEDLDSLILQRRPALTINKILSTIGTILGEQIYNRTEVLFRPSAGSPAEVAEALSKVWMQLSQANQLPWVRSDVFCDGIIRSRGFYDARMDYSDSVFGEISITQLNSKNVVIDPDAEEYDPDAWADVTISKWMSTNDIAVLYNEADADELKYRAQNLRYGYDSVDLFRDSFADVNGSNITEASYTGMDLGTLRNIRVLDRQYRKISKAEHFVDVVTGDMRLIPSSWDRNKIALFLERAGGQIAVTKKLVKRIRWTVTAGDVVLHDEWSPYQHFTVVPYFPYFRYGRTVGIVENLLSPQEILNKASSQELHIINTTANSGWIVEEDSLTNMSLQELEVSGAKTGLVVEYRKDAQPPVKIQPNQVPTGLDRVTFKAEEAIKSISNVSDSMQGFDREDVAAKAIAYKQQRGSVNLSKVLDNLERTDWILARNVLSMVQTFYTNERIINITKDDFANETETLVVNGVDPYTGAITNDLTIGEYDIVITSSPYRASLEDSQFEQAKALRELGLPIPDEVLVENSRLLRRADIVKGMKDAKNSPEAQAQAELEMRALQAEVAEKEAKVGKTQAEAMQKGADAQIKANEAQGGDNEMMKLQAELQMERERMDMELEKMRQEMALKMQEMQMKLDMQREEHMQNQQIKQAEAAQNMQLRQQQAEQQAEAQRVAAMREESAEPTQTMKE
jgi:hypothetical protein